MTAGFMQSRELNCLARYHKKPAVYDRRYNIYFAFRMKMLPLKVLTERSVPPPFIVP